MNRSLSPGRSIAVDPDLFPLDAPVWIVKYGKTPIRRRMIAQDAGATVNGAQRADIFLGTGDAADKRAATTLGGGRMTVIMPIQRAFAPTEGL